ncbi:MAG TPA: PAS domain-containing protein [Terriglobales bacterium]|nr:PAS domain-containing protein [Terriglobales bacterium]
MTTNMTGDEKLQAFITRIAAPELVAIARHWGEARNGKRMPAWRDIDPVKIAPYLPIVWSWRYDRENDTFIGRLAGDAINRTFGKSLRGARLQDFFSPDGFPKVYQRHMRIIGDPAFSRDHGAVFHHVDGVGLGERIVMPLAEDGEHADGVFGATTYDLSQIAPVKGVKYAFDNLEYLPV